MRGSIWLQVSLLKLRHPVVDSPSLPTSSRRQQSRAWRTESVENSRHCWASHWTVGNVLSSSGSITDVVDRFESTEVRKPWVSLTKPSFESIGFNNLALSVSFWLEVKFISRVFVSLTEVTFSPSLTWVKKKSKILHGLLSNSDVSSLFEAFPDKSSLSIRNEELVPKEASGACVIEDGDSVVKTILRSSQYSPHGLSKYVDRTDVWTKGLSALTMLNGVGR